LLKNVDEDRRESIICQYQNIIPNLSIYNHQLLNIIRQDGSI
jgi:hypothetical protein